MNAELSVEFVRKAEATAFRCLRQDPPWKVVRGFTQGTGESLVHLNNTSGGVFGGDSLKLSVKLCRGSEAQITTTGATRIYRPRSHTPDATLISEFQLGQGAILEYLPDALIPFRQARVLQRTAFSLEEGATLFYWETVAPGRAAAGELFQYERLRLVTEITALGRPVLNDRLLVEPQRCSPFKPSRFGSYTYLVTFVALRIGSTSFEIASLEENLAPIIFDQDREGEKQDSMWGVSTLPAYGVLVRGLLSSPVKIPCLLHSLWSVAKRQLCAGVAVAPRKTY